jgi:outer membrane protein assembly factor BamB
VKGAEVKTKKGFKGLMMIGIAIICGTFMLGEDWPQYLGPNRDSTSSQKGILRTWPEDGPEVLWTVDVGIGYGGPAVKDGKVYLLDRDDEVGDMMRCFNLSNGKELWRYEYDAPGSVMFPGSRSVPAVDGNRVYSCGPYGDLYCIDVDTHKPVWNNNVWADFGGDKIPMWAITQCPLIYGDLIIIASQAPNAGVVAYDKLSGDVKWATPSLGPVGYVSPAVMKVGGEDQVVMITAADRKSGGGKVVGIDPLAGKILWEYTNYQCSIPIPSAFDAGEARILITGGYRAGTAMLKVGKKADDSFGVTELYKTEEFGAHTKPPVLYNGHFYIQYSTNETRDGMVCMSMEGEIKWKTGKSPLFDKGSMILADGLILATDGKKTLYLIEPDPSEFRAIASAEMLGEKSESDDPAAKKRRRAAQNWAPIALADGKLLIRNNKQMKCVRVAQ